MQDAHIIMSDKELQLEGMEEIEEQIDFPNDPGLAIRGKTPIIGELRRKNDIPVIRDEVVDELPEDGIAAQLIEVQE